MKIRTKMLIILLCVLFIPLIIVDFYTSTKYANMFCEKQMDYLKLDTENMALYLNESFDNCISDISQFSSNQAVKKFVSESYEETGFDSHDKDTIAVEINHLLKKSKAVTEMFILNNSGKVLISSNKSDIGTVIKNAEEIMNYSKETNGISRLYTQTSNATNYVYIVKRVYSSTNATVGYVCQKINVSEIISSFKINNEDELFDSIIIDSEGRALVNGAITPVMLNNDSKFGIIAGMLSDYLPCYNGGHCMDPTTITVKKYTVFAASVSNSNWGIINCYNLKAAKSKVSKEYSSVTVMIVIVGILAASGVGFVVFYFTSPIDTISSIIHRLENGDKDLRIEIASKDEFGQLSNSLNTLFDKLFDSEQRFKTVLSMMDNVVFEVNLKNYTVYVSDNFNKKFSFRAKDDSIKESFLYKIKIHKDDAARFHEDVNRILTENIDRLEGEYRLRNYYGDFSWIRIKVKKYFNKKNVPTKIIGMLVDIDREKKSAITLIQKANYDALTSLYNRATFLRTMDEEILLSYSRRSLDALMFIDLDDFKHFNDEYGHKCGDEVLKFVAETIKEITFDKGFGGRLGGDEFVMCLTNLKLIGDAGNAASEIISILNEGFTSESTQLHLNIHCSIGIAFFRENGANSTELLEAADAAMYKIKKSGKSNYAFAGSNATEESGKLRALDKLEEN